MPLPPYANFPDLSPNGVLFSKRREREKNVISNLPSGFTEGNQEGDEGELGSVVIIAVSGDYLSIRLWKVPSLGRGSYQPRWLAGLGHQ